MSGPGDHTEEPIRQVGSGRRQLLVARKFCELPDYTQKFLCELGEKDIDALRDLLGSFQKAATIGNFVKWLVTGILGIALTAIAMGEWTKKIMTWLTH